MPTSYDVRPLVSVIIPCYNQAAYLAQAIESVLAQQYRPVEVIVVDDGSDEDVAGIVARYGGVRYVRQRNRGVSAARNRGFSVSVGEYIVFLDSDDRLASTALSDQLRELDANSDAVAAVGLCILVDADGRALPFDQQPPVGDDPYCELLAKNFVWMPAQVLYRRQPFAASGGFDSSVNACADYDLYLRLARTCRLACHRAVVAHYRVHDGSMSRNPARMLRAALVVLARQRRFVAGSSRHRVAWERGQAFWRGFYGDRVVEDIRRQLRTRGGRRAVWPHVLTLIRYYPAAIVRNLRGRLKTALQR